jgi:hypothetical protein
VVIPLPHALHAQLARLRRRIRLVRLCGGVAALLILASCLMLAVWGIESWAGLPVAGLRAANLLLIAAVVAVGAVTLVACLKPISQARLAAAVEKSFPQLGERLASTVELHGSPTHAPGSLLRHLDEETVHIATAIDFRRARPLTSTRRRLAAAAFLALAATLPLLWSTGYGRLQRRLLFAWSPDVYGYHLAVEPGDQYVGRGRSAVVAVRLTPFEDDVPLPTACTVVFQEAGEAPQRARMEPAGGGTFSHTWGTVSRPLRYWVETPDLVSARFDVTVVEPIALAEGGVRVEVTPPPYVNREVWPAAEHRAAAPFAVLQYSTLRLGWRFDRPAQHAMVRFKQGGAERTIELPLKDDGSGASWELLAAEVGPQSAQLILEAEHGVLWTHALPAWSVWADQPPLILQAPALGRVSTSDTAARIAPGERLPIKAAIEDQVGLGDVVWEYRINEGPVRQQRLADGQGKLHLALDEVFPLAALVKEGDLIRCRLRVNDNRRLAKGSLRDPHGETAPGRDLEPHVVVVPAASADEEAWWSFRIEEQAEPLPRQRLIAEHDALGRRIERIKKDLEQERKQIQKAALSSHQAALLSPADAAELSEIQKLNDGIRRQLHELGQEASGAGLQPLARLSSDIAEREMAQSEEALRRAGTKDQAGLQRERNLRQAEEAVAAALKRLGALDKLHALLARERLDVEELQRLAQQEQELARRAEALAQRGPEADMQEQEQLRAEQEQLARRFQSLLAKNPRLQQVLQAQRQSRALDLAKQTQALARAQRQAAKAADEAWSALLGKELADLARQQHELARRVATLDQNLKNQPAAAGLAAPHQPAAEAGTRLAAGDVEPALAKQQQTQQQLLALGQELDRAMAGAGDARPALQRLAQAQTELLKQLTKLGEDFARITIEETRTRLKELTQKQVELHEALGKVEVVGQASSLRQQAVDAVGQAARHLQQKDPLAAFQQMEEAGEMLQRLSAMVPAPLAPVRDASVALELKKHISQSQLLAKDQRELEAAVRRRLAELAAQRRRDPQDKKGRESLAQLSQDLKDFAHGAGSADKMSAQDAARAAQMAQQAMDKSSTQKQQGMLSQAKASEAEAAQQLDVAGKNLQDAAMTLAKQTGGQDAKMKEPTALQQAAQEAQLQLKSAQRQLQAGDKQAPTTMQQAAKALANTAQQAQEGMMAQANQSAPPGEPARTFSGAAPSAGTLTEADLKALAGRPWGELPGELRTRIVQDMRARYGEDYSRIIRRYFQQIAETK